MPLKDPQDRVDYGWDWDGSAADGGPWLKEGETVTTSTWTIETHDGDLSPLALDTAKGGATHDGTTTTIWLMGGTLGLNYDVTNHVVTSDGREVDRTLNISVRKR